MIWLIIAAMCAATYIPRILPLLLERGLSLPPFIRRWLDFFPYAALGCLIFPGILTAFPEKPWIGVAAGVCAAGVAWKARNATLPVLAGIAAAILLDLV